jgi:hypothetical protein
LTVAALLPALLSAIASLAGPIRWPLGAITLAVARPARPLAVAALLLLLAEGTRASLRPLARLRFAALFAVFFLALVAESVPRFVGDGIEYVAMASNLADGRPPALSADDLRSVRGRYPDLVGTLEWPDLVGADGRQDFAHFWLYPAFAAPFVRLARAFGAGELVGFTAFNLLLAVFVAFVLVTRAGPRVSLLLLGGPLVWWIDKAHAESFVVSLLLLSLALLDRSPRWALAGQGLAALQNPGLIVVPALSCAWLAIRGGLRGRRWFAGAALALGLPLLGPLYYLLHLGRSSPLVSTVFLHVPGWAEMTALVLDPNLGLLVAWPALVAAVVLAVTAGVRPGEGSLRSFWLELVLGATAALLLAVVSALPGNLNHGGTRSLSRYALWLVPLCLPLLAWLDRRRRWASGWLLLLALGSVASTFANYQPRQGERFLAPTTTASRLWRRHPGLDNPLPEVFAERVGGREGDDLLPAATEGCEKALLVGDGTERGAWPLWCEPRPKPPECRIAGRFCYANCSAGECRFVRAPREPAFEQMRPQSWYWTGAPDAPLVALLRAVPWKGLARTDAVGVRAELVEAHAIGQAWGLVSRDAFLVWFERPGVGAFVTIPPRAGHEAFVIDPIAGELEAHLRVGPNAPVRIELPRGRRLLLAVLPSGPLASADAATAREPVRVGRGENRHHRLTRLDSLARFAPGRAFASGDACGKGIDRLLAEARIAQRRSRRSYDSPYRLSFS